MHISYGNTLPSLYLAKNSRIAVLRRSVSSSALLSSRYPVCLVSQDLMHARSKDHDHRRYTNMYTTLGIQSRSFSVISHNKDDSNKTNSDDSDNKDDATPKNLRERTVDRARDMSERARQASRTGARRGSAMAKQGAKTTYQKLKQYGPVFVGTYASMYLVTLGTIYAGVDSGIIDPVTLFSHISNIAEHVGSAVSGAEEMAESKSTAEIVISYLDHYSWTKPVVPFLEKNPHFANLGVAWVATKFTEPIRLVVTMGIVPKLADYLGYVPHTDPDPTTTPAPDSAPPDEEDATTASKKDEAETDQAVNTPIVSDEQQQQSKKE